MYVQKEAIEISVYGVRTIWSRNRGIKAHSDFSKEKTQRMIRVGTSYKHKMQTE